MIVTLTSLVELITGLFVRRTRRWHNYSLPAMVDGRDTNNPCSNYDTGLPARDVDGTKVISHYCTFSLPEALLVTYYT